MNKISIKRKNIAARRGITHTAECLTAPSGCLQPEATQKIRKVSHHHVHHRNQVLRSTFFGVILNMKNIIKRNRYRHILHQIIAKLILPELQLDRNNLHFPTFKCQ